MQCLVWDWFVLLPHTTAVCILPLYSSIIIIYPFITTLLLQVHLAPSLWNFSSPMASFHRVLASGSKADRLSGPIRLDQSASNLAVVISTLARARILPKTISYLVFF
ncbi:uncharacterized protein BT62DRAFT_608268 [Guyanagaster necrorhizus]|uniref:Uncharacterized protein n=1 Tax=Guyanagaster necrorhizus TaxID=856835 RepID=A0A9P8AXD0_9AGAR|nr:uncharacterized protein BT62DRAFT_608268 [Guyanagaster necrorhizus MCA 3950]KAG7449812.1 hypothetical protein BT62DRAFT_608268 [Guyanagaster necrorhizus MCA 3950]